MICALVLDMILYLIFFSTNLMRLQNTNQKKESQIFLCHFRISKYLLDKNFLTIDVLNQKHLTKNIGKLACLFLINIFKSLTRFTDFNISCVQF
jgi:hypothetical protein